MVPALYQYQIITCQFIMGYGLADCFPEIHKTLQTCFLHDAMTKPPSTWGFELGQDLGRAFACSDWLMDKP